MPQRRISRTERAYSYLLEELLRGRWQPGDTLSTYALSEELGVSRTPVLEALKRLEDEGLVEIIPQVGCRVVRPTTRAVEELFAVRGVLEGLAAAAAARQIDDDALSELEVTLGQLDGAAGRGDRDAYDELSRRFHVRVAEASRMPRLVDAIAGNWAQLRYHLARLPIADAQLRESILEHRELYEALRRKAPQRARAAAQRHADLSAARLVAPAQRGGPSGLVHRALIYAGEGDFLAATVPFVQEGLDEDERVLAVTTMHNAELLARALGQQAGGVEFRDSNEWYQLPSHTLLSYERYLQYADRNRVRIIGEVSWNGGGRAAIDEWTRYESVLNVAFALEPVSILCPYDAAALPARVIADARRTHRELCTGRQAVPSPEFTEVSVLTRELDREALVEPEAPTAEHSVTPDLRGTRGFILEQAHRAGVSGKALQDTFLAVQDAAASVSGDGGGSIRAWVQDGELIYEVRGDSAGIDDPFIAPVSGLALMSDPRGLWMARLLCDLVEARVHDGELVVRLHTTLK
jgi:GntR family transcriptional regulator, rspAB operon transcriptional repressor